MKSNLHSELWKNINWKQCQKILFRLQCRIWKASKAGDIERVRNLQKLVLRSRAARLLAIRQVTQLNQGKCTAGIDGKAKLTFKERLELSLFLQKNVFNWKHQGLREIPIPKKDGTYRILKVPTIQDRAWQCLVKYAVEPAHEPHFHERSYGFRPGRSAHDCQKLLQIHLKSNANGYRKFIYEMDIEKCFDRINHRHLMTQVIAPTSIKNGLWSCLKAGSDVGFPSVEERGELKTLRKTKKEKILGARYQSGSMKTGIITSLQGVPQGGVISPLLANISLNGIEKNGKCIRYADDLVFIIDPIKDDPQGIWTPEQLASSIDWEVSQFLKERGLNIKRSKTKLVHSTDGFDFLGWHFYVQKNNYKFRSVPSMDNFKAFRKKVKHIVNSSAYGAKVKAAKLAPIVRGWRNYHRYCKMDGSRFSLWDMAHRAFKVFNQEKKQDRYSAKELVKKAFPSVPYSENRHINVQGNKSPYDGDLVYWNKRNSKLYDGATAKALTKQNHKCGRCGLMFTEGEKVELHHVDGNHNNWKKSNLLAVHRSCHQYIHMSQKGKSKNPRLPGKQSRVIDCSENPF